MTPTVFKVRSLGLLLFPAGLSFLSLLIATNPVGAAPSEPRVQLDDPEPFVCAQTAFAIDASESTGQEAFSRQITAFATAFRNSRLHRAIERCLPGSLAFTAITWSGPAQQRTCVDWTVVTNAAEGLRAAEAFRSCNYIGGTTDIGHAIGFAMRLLADSPFESLYRIVFVLTNGRTDTGSEAALLDARAEAVRLGITIDGYALLTAVPKGPAPFFVPDAVPLWKYVGEEVVAGPRSFSAHSRPGDDHEGLLRALIEMLRQELY